MEKIKTLYKKNEEIIIYLIVGILTTVFSWGACFVAKFFLDSEDTFQNLVLTTITWLSGVLFSYPLTRLWVFKSKNKHILKEFFGFAGSRLSTYFLDMFIMWFFVNVLPFTPLIVKLCNFFSVHFDNSTFDTINYWFVRVCISAVLVTVLNYVFSKVFIFRKKKDPKPEVSEKENSPET